MNVSRLILLVCCCLAGAVVPVIAAENTIPPSGTVFLGEDGLDITATGVTANTNIVWYGTGGSIGSAPSAVVFVTDPASFYVSPALFTGKTGPWFTETGNNLAFYVQNPQISIRVFDITSGFEVTPSTVWVPKGDTIGFQVDNNVYILANRPGSPGAPITIKIRGPDGIMYSAVDSFQLTDILISTPTYMTGPVWYTGDYGNGNYTVWTESTGNDMNTNYPQEGQTISTKVTFLMQSVNPLITPTTVRTTLPTTLPTTTVRTTVPTIPPTTLTQPPTSPSTPPTMIPTTAAPTTTPGFGAIIAVVSMGAVALLLRRKD
jgi:PGF-CTERM protein